MMGINVRPLTPALRERVTNELNEKPNEIEDRINELRQWIKHQPHLNARTDDQFLISFLRGCKYDMNLTKQKIDLFFTMRTMMPEITENRELRYGVTSEVIKLGITVPLPLTDGENGPRIFLICPGRYDPKKLDLIDIMKAYTLFTDYAIMEDDNMIISGQVGIIDLTNVGFNHFQQFTPAFVKKMTYFTQHSAPFRPAGFHYINTPDGFEYIFNMFKMFMSEENKKLLYVHGHDLESLYKHVPKRFLPTEYGGEAGNLQSLIDYWETKLIEKQDTLMEYEKYGTNELLRRGPPVTEETLSSICDGNNFFNIS